MTEIEAIKILKKTTEHTKVYEDDVVFTSDFVKAYEKAIKALEEIQQYREYKEIFKSHFTKEALKLLSDKEEFGKWLERGKWIAKRCDELNRELEPYRAIGTVEQLEWCKDASHWKDLFKEKLEQYQSIGTVEEFKYLKEKNEPKKPIHNGANWYKCHNGCEVHKKTFEKDWYCPKCGQKLDFGKEE